MAAVERLGSLDAAKPSFLEAVLSNAGQVEMTDLKERIGEVSQNVSQLKLRVHDCMKSKFVDFDPLIKKSKGFLEKAERTSEEINTLFNRIEFQTKHDLANSTGELRSLHDSLKDASTVLAVTTELLRIEALLKRVQDACEEEEFVEAAKSLESLRGLIEGSSQEVEELDIFRLMNEKFNSLYAEFVSTIGNKLSSFISWTSSEAVNNVVKSTIKLKTDDETELQEVIQTLHLLNELNPWMNRLRKFFMRSVLIPVIMNEASVSILDSEPYSSVQVAVKTSSRKPNYLSVLDNLTKCFEFLHGELDMRFENGDSFIGLLGFGISAEFSDTLITKCLNDTVPSTQAGLVHVSSIEERITSFNTYMVGIEFLSENDSSLLNFLLNIDALCANKACENYLKKAREIIKENLQEMVEVGPQTPSLPLSSTLDSTETGDASILMQESFSTLAIKPESELNANVFQFPKCFVSKSTLEILDLVGTILEEISGGSKEMCEYSIGIAKSVFEMYISVVPNLHEKLISTIPQQAALFHNNCMFLAHRLTVLGFEEASVQSRLNDEAPITFVDYVLRFRHTGTLVFLKHLQQQRKQILDLVKQSGLATLGENSQLSPDTVRTLRQCLRQLELLQTGWKSVLPGDIYSKSIGVLANAFVEELIVRVSSVEDIPANTAVQLTTFFKIVTDKIPQLFEDGSTIVLYVKKWRQFEELITILNASLMDIEERWADGKGPLAYEFSVEQVKQLIRALFQNTSRRAEVLAKIK